MIDGEERAARLERLFELERKHDLFSFRIDGWSAWRVMRNPIYWLVAELPVSRPGRPAYVRILEAMRGTLNLARLIAFGGRRELLVKTCRSALRVARGPQYEDVYFDSLLRRGYSCLKLEEINSPDFETQAAAAWRPPDLNPVVFTFWGRVLGRLFPADAMPFCSRVAELLKAELQVVVSPDWLLMRVSTVVWQARLYSLLLARSRPGAILVSDTGEYGLRLAAHRQGIRFIELQHGVFDASQPDAIPLWVEGSAVELVLPDVLATRGDYWSEQLASTRQGRDHAVAVGDAMTDWARARRNTAREGRGVHLVLTSQGLDTSRLVDWIDELANCAPASLEWRLSIKLHPVYDCSPHAFERLKKHERIRIISGAEQPNVFELLADGDLHLTIASACHFDAAAIGVRSMVIPLAGHELLTKTIDGKLFFLACTQSKVWEVAANADAPDLVRANRFSSPGYVDNLAALLPSTSSTLVEAELASCP
ncbi:hypothetical protein IVB30_11825 [Bradyrhizobium sp. 200]|uniref:hypothetical protein n=1 Tax=Bradyrhizobium sp. 200 TaxID=2782665 RepID=UPI00200008A1|nr:hypothetical protein [Bradyrhizobium sp. 200]UPJ51971.1 hypothetical protein IVB30_11825 [Bradyrhizobium sp. 200]